MAGNTIYTVVKELDFATNVVNGPFADSGLGEVFRAARDGEPGTVYMVDFRPYAPSNGAPAGFLAEQVIGENGQPIGIVAVQMPMSRLAELVVGGDDLGVTGDAYLIGADLRARSTSRFDDRFTATRRSLPSRSFRISPPCARLSTRMSCCSPAHSVWPRRC